MPQIKLTLEIMDDTAKGALKELSAFAEKLGNTVSETFSVTTQVHTPEKPSEIPVEKPATAKPASKAKPAVEETPIAEEKQDAPAVSKSDVRAAALVFSKAGKQAVLKEVFAKYGAEKLSDIPEDKYPALMADLEAANG